MKRSSHISKNHHPRRKAIPGLTPEDVIAQMAEDANGKVVRKMRSKNFQPQKPVLPLVRKTGPDKAGEGGVFPAAEPGDDKRAGGAVSEKVSDSARATQISRVLKRLLGEAPPELVELGDIGKMASNAEALAAVILRQALDGKQWAIELIRDQCEGKPVRAAQVNNTDADVEEMLDRVSTLRLNELAKRK